MDPSRGFSETLHSNEMSELKSHKGQENVKYNAIMVYVEPFYVHHTETMWRRFTAATWNNISERSEKWVLL